jgi:hypothetical protein
MRFLVEYPPLALASQLARATTTGLVLYEDPSWILRIRTLIGEAGRETRAATQTDQDGERFIKHTDIHLRIRLGRPLAACELGWHTLDELACFCCQWLTSRTHSPRHNQADRGLVCFCQWAG